MYKELESDIPGFEWPSHDTCLLGWAQQGVLLLNACLTVKAHKANSHKDIGWEKFTDSVIKTISVHNKGVVFLLWGSYAQKKAKVVHTLVLAYLVEMLQTGISTVPASNNLAQAMSANHGVIFK
ncbi:Uracil-DNA glycosylase-like 3 [Homarus americanus]|uniref:Uracil-DNA glycosylase-like 3 n=1 Tax=Homarus americanus TaxID=6706 RepID=A0A8J5K6H0_HOMAM|nr:Uracil-DNA glycosylase-like 3 [Homarus americanus]